MDTSSIITICIFGAVQLISLGGVIISNKLDTKVLSVRVDGLQLELKKLSNVLIELVAQNGRLNLFEERQLAQGKRLDETTNRLNRHIDVCKDGDNG